MSRRLHAGAVIPRGLVIDHVEIGAVLTITARPVAASARCPGCDRSSSRIHSHYTRTLSDLPVAGRRVALDVRVRRFRCIGSDCRTKIFAERLGSDLAAAYARRTARLDCIVHHLGVALGGRPAASFARRLMVPASRDTMLRTARRRAVRPVEHPRVIGIDDRAFRRGQRYGTLVCDLERRRVIALLPDRESSTVEAWLAVHPEVTVVARDRGGCYGEATTRALPKAIQVADRWHLMENASAAFLNAVRKSMVAIRIAVGAATVDPERLTCAERLQYDGYLRREATGEAILALSRQGTPIKKIARMTGHSRKLVRDVLRGLTGEPAGGRQRTHGGRPAGARRLGRPPPPRPHGPSAARAGAAGAHRGACLRPRPPVRDLTLSPGHGVFCDGVLIPAGELVNGRTVTQIDRPSVAYWHVELDRHDVLVADGLTAESYLDTGNRAEFANGGGPLVLHPTFAAMAHEAACAPFVVAGPVPSAVRARLAKRADAMEQATKTARGWRAWLGLRRAG